MVSASSHSRPTNRNFRQTLNCVILMNLWMIFLQVFHRRKNVQNIKSLYSSPGGSQSRGISFTFSLNFQTRNCRVLRGKVWTTLFSWIVRITMIFSVEFEWGNSTDFMYRSRVSGWLLLWWIWRGCADFRDDFDI